jgi:hypothetical protein
MDTAAIMVCLLIAGVLVRLDVHRGDLRFLVLFGGVAFGVVLASASYPLGRSHSAVRTTATAGSPSRRRSRIG